mgnify:CR=1 FL=1
MKVFENISNIENIKNCVLTIGGFDGMHLGHTKVLDVLVNESKRKQCLSSLVTFFPSPAFFIRPQKFLGHIDTKKERIKKIKDKGIDILCIIPFDKEVKKITADSFLKNIIIEKFNPSTIIVGYDHHFGLNREGNYSFLKKNQKSYGYRLLKVEKLSTNDRDVSSSNIRDLIKKSNFKAANALLGEPFALKGIVVRGKGLGSKIGFPTSNIKIDKHKLIPEKGAYIVKVSIGKAKYKGICNIGHAPTISNKEEIKIEVHIIDFDNIIYDKLISIEFCCFLRPENKFPNIEVLKKQLFKDRNKCLEYSFDNS